MKKTLSVFLLFSLFLFLVPQVIATETEEAQPEDSLTVSQELREALGASETDTVYRIYKGYYYFGNFAKKEPIQSIIEKSSVVYMVENQGELSFYRFEDNKYVKQGCLYGDILYQIILGLDEAINTLGPFVEVQNVYFLDGIEMDNVVHIYIKTDKGDYICHNPFGGYREVLGSYMVPLDAFCDYAVKELERDDYDRNTDGGIPVNKELLKTLEKYKIGDKSGKLALYITSAVVLIAAGAGTCLFFRKKRRNQKIGDSSLS